MAELWCRYCGPEYPLRIEWREALVAKPITTFSLSGQQIKVSATKQNWPWAICDNCKRESQGKVVEQ